MWILFALWKADVYKIQKLGDKTGKLVDKIQKLSDKTWKLVDKIQKLGDNSRKQSAQSERKSPLRFAKERFLDHFIFI